VGPGPALDKAILVPVPLGPGERLRVVATTSVVGDVVAAVGGEHITLTTLLPAGTDPHAFQPTAEDYQAVARAHVVFLSGAGLEVFMEPLLAQSGEGVPVVELSAKWLPSPSGADGFDPHVWLDPLKVRHWVERIGQVLGTLDPQRGADYDARAAGYLEELEALDRWIREQVALIPQERRVLVSDHLMFSHFAERYGFQILGALLPAHETGGQLSARHTAELIDRMREMGVTVIFVEHAARSKVAEQLAQDLGMRLVPLYVGSLSPPDGPAPTYTAMMRLNVERIVDALSAP
jgi:ABC-type Zn uptake system ZnuABC Zn-binding protein ZnuA